MGDCWLLAAMASLAMRRDLLDQVILPNQDFESSYNGKFYFRFWVPYMDPKSSQFEILEIRTTWENYTRSMSLVAHPLFANVSKLEF